MAHVDFLSVIHKSTERDYHARVLEFPRAEAARLAKKWDVEYWEGDCKTGYGGYRYDGRLRQSRPKFIARRNYEAWAKGGLARSCRSGQRMGGGEGDFPFGSSRNRLVLRKSA